MLSKKIAYLIIGYGSLAATCTGWLHRKNPFTITVRFRRPGEDGRRASGSSFKSSSLWTFFERMFVHSPTSNSGAINFAFWRSARASAVPSSSTTHLMAMLASPSYAGVPKI